MTRLLKPANAGDLEILIEPDLDLYKGDRIAILSSSYAEGASDDRMVKDYNYKTGLLKLEVSLLYYHWGQKVSTAKEYNGVDMRSEVLILSRSIKIQG